MPIYTFSKTVAGDIEAVRERVIYALGEHGFGVLTEIDVAATMKAKLDKDIPAYRILGACNPSLAFRAIGADPSIGALLPCNVVLRQTDEGVVVEFMDPESVLSLVPAPGVEELATQVKSTLQQIAASL